MFFPLTKRLTLVLLATAFLFLFSEKASFAQIMNPNLPERQGVKLGEVSVHSALSVGGQYDSNIFLTPSDEKSDFITVINPSVGFEIPLQDNSFSAEYNAAINEYSNHNHENHVDHQLEALGKIVLTDYTINLSDMFKRFTSRRDSETAVRLRQLTNDARVGVTAQFDQLAFDVGYTNKVVNYVTDAAYFGSVTYKDRDYMAHVVDLTGSYRFMPKTSALLEADLGTVNFKKAASPDAKFIELLAGLRGDPSEDLSLNLRAGAKHQEYDSSTTLNDDNFTGFVARGGADYRISQDDKLSLALERGIYESIYQNMNYYVLNQVGLNYKHMFTHKLSGGLSAAYQRNAYPKNSIEGVESKKRADNIYLAGSRVSYDIQKWLAAALDYTFTKKDSNFSIYDYKDHVVMLTLTAGF